MNKTRADEIRADFRGNANGPQFHREIVSDHRIRVDAQQEIGKLGTGFDFDVDNWGSDRSTLLNKRSELRRLQNQMGDDLRALVEANPGDKWTGDKQTAYDARMNAMAYLGSLTNLVETQIDPESKDGRMNRTDNSYALRDKNGGRIGTVLTPDAMATPQDIAARLNMGAPGDASLGDFFRGVAGMKAPESIRNALGEGTDSAGGYLVPGVLMPSILSALVPASSLLQAGASVAILSADADTYTIAGVNSIPTAGWRSEHGNVAESDPAFRAITVTPRSLAFRFKVSRELLQDAPNLERALPQIIAQSFAKEMDRAGLRGSGTAPEIRGLLNTTGVNAVTNGANGASLTNYARLLYAARVIKEANAPTPNAVITSIREEEKFANFADTTGQPLRRPDAIAGWKFVTTSQIPTNLTVGTSTDCSEMYVGDFSQFVYFMREGVSIQRLNELYAATGEVGFVCHARVDVAALHPSAFSIITGVRA